MKDEPCCCLFEFVNVNNRSRQVQINNKNDTAMVNTRSGQQDQATHKESQQGKKIAKVQHGWGKILNS